LRRRLFIGDDDLKRLWIEPQRCYLLAEASQVTHLRSVLGDSLHLLEESGGKFLF
jgi:hypothetical protein